MTKGDSTTYSFTWTPDLATYYDTPSKNDIVTVVFLQNEVTKEVHQATMVGAFKDPTSITGLENAFSFEDVAIYPNPADHQLNVVFPNRLEVDVPMMMFDQMGRITHNTKALKGEQSATLETGGVASGVYILQLDWGGGKASRTKIIIGHKE